MRFAGNEQSGKEGAGEEDGERRGDVRSRETEALYVVSYDTPRVGYA